ncbi:MAG: hypothetical protein R3E89_10720 [Thiolinea sp.]
MGARSDPAKLQALRRHVAEWPADPQALADGLAILENADFSQQLPALPTRWLLGRLDRLIPVSLAEVLQQQGQAVEVFPHAAHVPFITHPELF